MNIGIINKRGKDWLFTTHYGAHGYSVGSYYPTKKKAYLAARQALAKEDIKNIHIYSSRGVYQKCEFDDLTNWTTEPVLVR